MTVSIDASSSRCHVVAADDGDRHPAGVALDQLGGGGQLVDDAQLLDPELVAVRIDLADVAVHRGDAGDADGDVGLALAPRAPERVADDDGDVGAELGEAGADARGPTRRSPRAAARPGRRRRSSSGRSPLLAHTKPWWVSVISTGPTIRTMRSRLAQHELDDPRVLVPLRRPLGGEARRRDVVELDDATLGLGHDLRRDDDDVAVDDVAGAARSAPPGRRPG